MDKLRNGLNELIEEEFGKIMELEGGSEDRRDEVENLNKLYKLHLEDVKLDMDYTNNTDKLEAQEKDQKLDRILRYGSTVAIVLFEGGVAIWAYKAGLRFEQTGSFTSSSARVFGGIRRMFSFKKN